MQAQSSTNSALTAEIHKSRCLYFQPDTESFRDLLQLYLNGKIDKYNFIKKMHLKFSVLFDLQELIKSRDISSFSINKENVTVCLPNGLRFNIDRGCRSAVMEIMNFGAYETEELSIITSILTPSSTILDIGAHIGWHAITLAQLFPTAMFYVFEPVKPTYQLLIENIELNGAMNIQPYNLGLSNCQREASFYYSEVGSAVASEANIFDIEALGKIKCQLTSLDDFVSRENIEAVDFIKCDVEGAELLVIKGGKNTIQRHLPVIVCEIVEDWCHKFKYSSSELLRELCMWGYGVYEIFHNKLKEIDSVSNRKIDSFNYFFLHKQKHADLIHQLS